MNPLDLSQVLRQLPSNPDPRLLVGIGLKDDAGVYKLSDNTAIVNTVDMITPVVDGPEEFGGITVANALSDIYAMGATPLTALNIVCYPRDDYPIEVITGILEGGLRKMTEAKVALVGGHTIRDPELKYGVAVTGTVHPERIIANSGAKPGDSLVLTKKLGVGVVTTAIKNKIASPSSIEEVTESMLRLNRDASEIMLSHNARAATDITGFGFLGHAHQLARASGVALEIDLKALPVFDDARTLSGQDVATGVWKSNREAVKDFVSFGPDVSRELKHILFEAETSGGLLIALPPEQAEAAVQLLRQKGDNPATVVGEVVDGKAGAIRVS
ncbi:selenide, water dikinase SelD [candidate division KSB1 bacterium]